MRRTDAGEAIVDTLDFEETPETNYDDFNEEKIEALTEMICRGGDEPGPERPLCSCSWRQLKTPHPKALANTAKHLAFTRCGELNLYGMVDSQIAVAEEDLLTGNTLMS